MEAWDRLWQRRVSKIRRNRCRLAPSEIIMRLKKHFLRALFLFSLMAALFIESMAADEGRPPASPEVTAAMQPYLGSCKLAGLDAIIADKTGKVHYRNLLGFADVDAKKKISEDNVYWIASMSKMFAGASIMMLVDEGEWEGKRYLSHAAMEELRREQTGATRVNYSLGYHLRNGLFGHDGAYGTDLSVNPKTGLVALLMVQCPGPGQWEARDLFLKTATQVFAKITP